MSDSSSNGWTVLPLGKAATLQRGFDLPVKQREPGEVPVFAANGPVGTHNEAKVRGPGVVTGRSGTIGKVHYVDGDYWPLNTSLFVKDFHGNYPKFIYYLLSNMRLEQFHEGTGVPTLNRNNVHAADISLPPLSEQKRIADILDKADAIRRKRQEAIESLDAIRQAAIHDTILRPQERDDWREARLGDIAAVKGGIALSSRRKELERKAPYLRVANVYRDRLDLAEIKEIGLTDAEFERTKLCVGDVLIVEGHGNRDEIGRSAIWDGSIPDCVHQNHLIRVRPNESVISSLYLSAFINSPLGRRQLFRFGKTTSGLNTISLSNVRDTVIQVPPLHLQHRMEKVVVELTRLLTPVSAAFGLANDLFNSLVQRAFTGKL